MSDNINRTKLWFDRPSERIRMNSLQLQLEDHKNPQNILLGFSPILLRPGLCFTDRN